MNQIMSLLTGTGGLFRVRGIVTIVAVVVTMYMWANGDAVSATQIGLVTGWTGFYFGTRADQSAPIS